MELKLDDENPKDESKERAEGRGSTEGSIEAGVKTAWLKVSFKLAVAGCIIAGAWTLKLLLDIAVKLFELLGQIRRN